MPRYYFRIEDGEPIRDAEAVELPNEEAAIQHAAKIARELGKNRTDGKLWRVIADDENGRRITAVPAFWKKNG